MGDIQSNDLIRQLQEEGTLEDGIMDCLQAAAHEFTASQQKVFLRAVSFGKSFDPGFETDFFVDTCRKLRVLNCLQRCVHPVVGWKERFAHGPSD